ncbi:acetyltransferase [Arvimicrobium flavum]|uniref:acetyltransferase n=1 Tax=Arvimicrobium flavum TaxID=3393320 RepID=UPI00237AA141|nr:acetyltransferase [Mesorhizobium shangrilense]
MKPKLVVLGGGGHAKVAMETIRDEGRYEIVGFLDGEAAGEEVLGLPRLGNDDVMATLRERGVTHVFPAVGSNKIRVRLGGEARQNGLEIANAVSPFAYVSKTASVGSGVLIVAGAVINAEATIGDFAIVNTTAVVDHDTHVGVGAHIAPRSALAGKVKIGPQVLVGVGASVLPDVSIGAHAIIGAGSCVVCDIPPNAKAYGVPARVVS